MSRSICLPLIARSDQHRGRTAVVDAQGSFTYNDLTDASSRVATALLAGRDDPGEERVAFVLTPGFPWIATQCGVWRGGGIAVPPPVNATSPQLVYLIDDAVAATLAADTARAS